jgi:HTH-type transcriptional regulator, transcriptional repressor of NAD biosynthesis genes
MKIDKRQKMDPKKSSISERREYKKGVVLGKFMPLHKGHEYLIRFAVQCCEELTVVVDCLEGQTIPTEVRKGWIEQTFPTVRVVALKNATPQTPGEDPNFWTTWGELLKGACAGKVDVVVAAMEYGKRLSEEMNCAFIPCDIARESVPISATDIRANPEQHWAYLSEAARPYFVEKVCVVGPESTGKTTLVKRLADSHQTVHVPEYACAAIKGQGGEFLEHNAIAFARAQNRSENALAYAARHWMFCDSDAMTTLVWYETVFGAPSEELVNLAKAQSYTTTILLYPDVEWVEDVHRMVSKDASKDAFRVQMFERMKHWLKVLGREFVVVSAQAAREVRDVSHLRSLCAASGIASGMPS